MTPKQSAAHQPLDLSISIQPWELLTPFSITGYTWTSIDLLSVSLAAGGHTGGARTGGEPGAR